MVGDTWLKQGDCTQVSARLGIFEAQLLNCFEAFHVPEDYQQRLLEEHKKFKIPMTTRSSGTGGLKRRQNG